MPELSDDDTKMNRERREKEIASHSDREHVTTISHRHYIKYPGKPVPAPRSSHTRHTCIATLIKHQTTNISQANNTQNITSTSFTQVNPFLRPVRHTRSTRAPQPYIKQ
jgi:hypothetical protein